MSIIDKAYKKQQQEKENQQGGQGKPNHTPLKRLTPSLSGAINALSLRQKLGLVGLIIVILLAISALRDNGYVNSLLANMEKQQSSKPDQKAKTKDANVSATETEQSQKQASTNVNLTGLVNNKNQSELKSATVTTKDDKIVLSMQFSKLPFYRVDENDGEVELTFSQTNAGKTQIADKNNLFKNIDMIKDNDHLKLKLALRDGVDLDNIDSDKRGLQMVFNKPQTEDNQQKQPANNNIKKVKHQLSDHEKATRTIKRSRKHISEHHYAQAANELRQALGYEPNNAEAQKLLATVYLEQGKLAKAMDLIEKGLQRDEDTSGFTLLKAYVLIQQHETDEALNVLESDQPLSVKDNLSYYALMANLHLRQQHFEQASELYKELLQYDSSAGRWWIGLAIAYEKLERRNSAKQAFEQALQDDNLPPSLRSFASKRAKSYQ